MDRFIILYCTIPAFKFNATFNEKFAALLQIAHSWYISPVPFHRKAQFASVADYRTKKNRKSVGLADFGVPACADYGPSSGRRLLKKSIHSKSPSRRWAHMKISHLGIPDPKSATCSHMSWSSKYFFSKTVDTQFGTIFFRKYWTFSQRIFKCIKCSTLSVWKGAHKDINAI